MTNAQRRWRSEQVSLPTKRCLPTHKAVRLRALQAQQDFLRSIKSIATTKLDHQSSDTVSTVNRSGEEEALIDKSPTTTELPLNGIETSDTQLTSNASRTSNGILVLNDTKTTKEVVISNSKSSNTQIDGAERFPNIATVIDKSRRDNLRSMAEADFYEAIGRDGVVKRRSVMRSVAKDDCLLGRGANPRTGLITPDAVSVVGSLDTNVQLLRAQQSPSAKWKMDGDQWISVESTNPGKKASHANNTSLRNEGRKASPLTESNLQSHAKQQEREASETHTLTPVRSKAKARQSSLSHQINASTPPEEQNRQASDVIPTPSSSMDVNKIRRKPVSASKGSIQPLSNGERSTSTDTVIKTPTVKLSRTEYFSPEDVVQRPSHELSAVPSIDGRNISFLDQMVEHQSAPRQHLGCFTDRVSKREQLEQSLRTSSGPYPSTHSNHRFPQIDVGLVVPMVPNTSRPRYPSRPAQMAQSLPKGRPRYLSASPRPIMMNRVREKQQMPQPFREQDMLHKQLMTAHRSRSDAVLRDCRPHELVEEPVMNMEAAANLSQRPHFGQGQNTSQPVHSPRHGKDQSLQHNSDHRRNDHSSETTTVVLDPLSSTGTVAHQTNVEEDAEDSTSSVDDLPRPPEPAFATKAVKHSGRPAHHTLSETVSTEQSEIDHSKCCPDCCVRFDCHDSCLGHASPAVSSTASETSSLLSIGVFDSNFATSVEAVNEMLMTPKHERISKLAKLGNVFAGQWPARSPSPKRHEKKPELSIRTLHDKHFQHKTQRPSISSPVLVNSKGAITAAVKAMEITQRPKPTRMNAHDDGIRHRKHAAIPDRSKYHSTANQSRRLSQKGFQMNSSEWLSAANDSMEGIPASHDRFSLISRMSSVMCRSQFQLNQFSNMADLMPQILPFLGQLRNMLAIVSDTTSTITGLAVEYKCSGTMTLPNSITAAELVGNVLRSFLFVMIGACLYALFAKVTRAVLVVLRIVLLPVRLCAWVIG